MSGRKAKARTCPPPPVPGLAARDLAVSAMESVLGAKRALDDAFESGVANPAFVALESRDVALARAIALAAFRHLGLFQTILARHLPGGLPNSPRAKALLLAGAAQILELDVPDHAAVSTMVSLARQRRGTDRFAGLVNAVLRKVATDRAAYEAGDALADNTPAWLAARWQAHFGVEAARAISAQHRRPATLDLSCKGRPGESDPEAVAEAVGGRVLFGHTVRVQDSRAVEALPGFEEGAWWVQDVAAAVPARLLDVRPGEKVLDLCAAPGGKTAQLCARGAEVTALDRSPERLQRVVANLARLRLEAVLHAGDALAYADGPFDAILLDAPCSATGTLRRNPDVAWLRQPDDIATLAALQARLIDHALTLLRPGGRLVFATCSLEPEEGEHQIARVLAMRPNVRVAPPLAGADDLLVRCTTPEGFFRSLPHSIEGGCDGFFAACLHLC